MRSLKGKVAVVASATRGAGRGIAVTLVVALASDPQVNAKSGQSLSSWGLSDEYGFTDIDGRRPHWGRYFEEHIGHSGI